MIYHIPYDLRATQQSEGMLRVRVTSDSGQFPIPNARVTIRRSNAPDTIINEITTDSSGNTEEIMLEAPPVDYSMQPDSPQPYANYTIDIYADNYEPVRITDSELLPDVTSIQPVKMRRILVPSQTENIVIAPHTLFYDYPPKIPEDEIKTVEETGEIILSRVVIPEFIIVHDGPPNDPGAQNYYVNYTDYIKNVVSSEIYATWPESTIYANTLAIMSFTLNRVYTEWYRNQGYNFTITTSTAYDQKWINGRNIYSNVERIVDSIFNNYLSRPGIRQPLFTTYCDGVNHTCNGLSQWGSKYLGDEGLSAIDILRNYYGNDIYINSTDYVSGVPSSFPGYTLTQGSRGEPVVTIQEQLNRISDNYPLIPKLNVDGILGPKTAEAIRVFQSIFDLPETGTVDAATWYKLSQIFVGVTRIAEPE